MAKVFVTGGSGFVGAALVRRLAADGATVVALARNEASAAFVEGLGATSCRGDLLDAPAVAAGMSGCETVFHIAGHLKEWDDYSAFHRSNVEGTRVVLAAARSAGVRAFVAAGASAVVMGRPEPLLDISEDLPLQSPAWAPYIATKAEAERLVRDANTPGFRTVVIRPPLIWGKGMPMLDAMVAAAKSGRFPLLDGGRQKMSTVHVDNVAQALILAAEKGRGGAVYNVTDGENRTLGDTLADLLATRATPPIRRVMSFALAWRVATVLEFAWKAIGLRAQPPVTRQSLRMIGQDFTLDITRARNELGYQPIVGWREGLAAMR